MATALHHGHTVRPAAADEMAIEPEERRREEDPFTGIWARTLPTHLVGVRSRFEVDLNRSPEKAVYLTPEDAWGLTVWKEDAPSDEVLETSREQHTVFYERMKQLLQDKVEQYGGFILYDIHSYNHRREGPTGPLADVEGNPEVDLGTAWVDRERWDPVVRAWMDAMVAFDYKGRELDVRENVKFGGGHFVQWVNETFPEGCAVAIEFKKFWMDEWTGTPDYAQIGLIRKALASTLEPVQEAFQEQLAMAERER